MIPAVHIVSGAPHEATSISIKKTYGTQLPFIGDSGQSYYSEPSYTFNQWVGVQCIHTEFIVSPHLTGSHIESARHVIGDGKSIQDAIGAYRKPLDARHVKIKAEHVYIDQIESQNGIVTFLFSSGDTYTLISKEPVLAFPTEFVLTKSQLSAALGDFKEKTVLICFVGHEESIHNWPYLTNEAVEFLVEKGVEVIGTNIPSFDRESDGGLASNHKKFFTDQRRIIVESLKLEQAPKGSVTLLLNPEPLYDGCQDATPCDPIIVIN